MAGKSVEIETPLVDGLAQAESWISNNSDLLIQYGVNVLSAILILFIGNIFVKIVANSVAKMLKRKIWIKRLLSLSMVWYVTYCL